MGQTDKLRFLYGKSFDTMVLLAACYTFFLTHGEKIGKVLYEMAMRSVCPIVVVRSPMMETGR